MIFDYKTELFKPILIQNENTKFNKLLNKLRLLIDTPHRTIITNLKKNIKVFRKNKNSISNLLDLGCGTCFYKKFIPKNIKYYGLEVNDTRKFFNNANKELIFYNGKKIPFPNNYFYNIMCFEVLEHVYDYNNFIKEVFRVLKKDGILFLSVPFASKFHYIPSDFFRFTPSAIKKVLEDKKLNIVKFVRRGDDITVAFHMFCVALLGFFFRKNLLLKVLGILFLPLAFLFGCLANFFEILNIGAKENTLGYFIVCKK